MKINWDKIRTEVNNMIDVLESLDAKDYKTDVATAERMRKDFIQPMIVSLLAEFCEQVLKTGRKANWWNKDDA